MSKRITGPWRITAHDQRCVVVEDGSVGIADCRIVDHDYQVNVANARLVAAAPELLEACKAAMEYAPNVVERERLYAAIAKAEGGATPAATKGI